MKADPGQQWKLLDLAALDTRTAQIVHRRKNLPESQAAAEARAGYEAAHADLVRARTALSDVEREVGKAESDVQLVRDRAARTRSRLDDGSASARDLQNLQAELASLERRAAILEDEQLAVMERAEHLAAKVASLEAAEPAVAEAAEAAQAAEQAALARLDEERDTIARSRTGVVGGISAELVALYEKIREQTGMGAAALTQRRCGGCNLELLGADLRRVAGAPEDEVVRCEECRRILVRTSESGL